LLSSALSCRDFNFVLFLIMRPPPISTLFPYTTLFRSDFSDYQFDVGHFEARKEFFLHPDWEYLENERTVTSDQAKKRLLEDEDRSEEHTSELQSRENLVCRLLLEKKKKRKSIPYTNAL